MNQGGDLYRVQYLPGREDMTVNKMQVKMVAGVCATNRSLPNGPQRVINI